jgi:hypothetical protein
MDIIRWQLELGDEVIGQIIDEHAYEFPWAIGRLVDDSKFERFRGYLNFDYNDEDRVWSESLEEFSEEIKARGGFILRDLETGMVESDIILYDYGNNLVCFRW